MLPIEGMHHCVSM